MPQKLILLAAVLALLSCSGGGKHSIEIQNEDDIAGLRIATTSGSCYALDLSARKDITLQQYANPGDAIQSLLKGLSDVMVYDEVVFNAEVRKENAIKIALKGKQTFPTAFMCNKDNPELARVCTEVIQRMEADGSMQRLKDFWLTDEYATAGHFTHIPDESTGKPLSIAACAGAAPISFQSDGEWYGIEIDILREVAKELNRPLEIKLYDTATGVLTIKSGRADLLCGCVFITPEREQEFLFSKPYHHYHSAYFVIDQEARNGQRSLLAELKKGIQKNLIYEKRWKLILQGLWETLKISILAILLGSALGVGLCFMHRSRRKWVRTTASVYGMFISGIPQLVLLLILFYVVFAGSGIPADIVAVIAFAMFFASSASDIYGTSLDAIPRGQTEAGLALGFTRLQTFFNIVLPQAARQGLPLFRGQCVSLLKGTSIVGYIAIQDVTRAGDLIRTRTFDALIPLLTVTVIYFLLVWLFGALLKLASPKKKVL